MELRSGSILILEEGKAVNVRHQGIGDDQVGFKDFSLSKPSCPSIDSITSWPCFSINDLRTSVTKEESSTNRIFIVGPIVWCLCE